MSLYIPDETHVSAIESAQIATNEIMSRVEGAPPDIAASFAKMLLSLVTLILLMVGTYWILKRVIQQKLQKGNADSSIRILEKRMLSPKTMLYLVETEGKKVLMAESHLEVKCLTDIPEQTRQ